MTDSEGKNFVGYFTPTEEALRQREEDLEDGGRNFYKEGHSYVYSSHSSGPMGLPPEPLSQIGLDLPGHPAVPSTK